jgi:hypothetical protein
MNKDCHDFSSVPNDRVSFVEGTMLVVTFNKFGEGPVAPWLPVNPVLDESTPVLKLAVTLLTVPAEKLEITLRTQTKFPGLLTM